jgi:hypothetical protein
LLLQFFHCHALWRFDCLTRIVFALSLMSCLASMAVCRRSWPGLG